MGAPLPPAPALCYQCGLQIRPEATMKYSHAIVLLLSGFLLAACQEEQEATPSGPAPAEFTAPAKDVASTTGQPEVVVYKTASCGCCKVWVEHMQSHGFPVKTENVDNLGPIKERAGVPYGMGACHTAQVDGYFIEGHVPAADVQRLLAEKPKAKGLTVPGMPIGSPGMEEGDRVDPYEVLLVHEDGSTSVYARYPK
jgi:hypothetical protein